MSKIRNYTDNQFRTDINRIRGMVDEDTQAVIAPYRGGLTLGTKLSHVLNLPLGIIQYQRLDSMTNEQILNLAIEPVGKTLDGLELPFSRMDKILLVDDICDTGSSIEKIYRYLKLLNPNLDITVICLFGNNESDEYLRAVVDPDIKLHLLRDNLGLWILFETWENDLNRCRFCSNGEKCWNDKMNKTHCKILNKSFDNKHSCSEFKFYRPQILPDQTE